MPALYLEAALGRSIISFEVLSNGPAICMSNTQRAISIILHWSHDSMITVFKSSSCPRNDQQCHQGEPSCHDDAVSLHLNTGPFDFGLYPFSFNVVKQFIFIRHGEKVKKGTPWISLVAIRESYTCCEGAVCFPLPSSGHGNGRDRRPAYLVCG